MIRCHKICDRGVGMGGKKLRSKCNEPATNFFRRRRFDVYFARCPEHHPDVGGEEPVCDEIDENTYVVGMIMES